MGVKETAPLVMEGDAYGVTVPRNRKMTTSLFTNSQPTLGNSCEGLGWGYSQFVSTPGAGIPVGGKIEFFVGTRKQSEAERARKAFGRHLKSRGIDRGRHLTVEGRDCVRNDGTAVRERVPHRPNGQPLFNSRPEAGPTPCPHHADGRLCHGVRAGRTAGRGAPWTSATIRPCRSPWSEPERYAPRPGQS
jgi:hypothetical protein